MQSNHEQERQRVQAEIEAEKDLLASERNKIKEDTAKELEAVRLAVQCAEQVKNQYIAELEAEKRKVHRVVVFLMKL